jgi:hypothetical protein
MKKDLLFYPMNSTSSVSNPDILRTTSTSETHCILVLEVYLTMLTNIMNTVFTAREALLAGAVINNTLNPWHLSFATSAYIVQSTKIHIPDHLGFFSRGPPRLQVDQTACFAAIIFIALFMTGVAAWSSLMLLLLRSTVKMKFVAAYSGMLVCFIVGMWAITLGDEARKPGHLWRDWKERDD